MRAKSTLFYFQQLTNVLYSGEADYNPNLQPITVDWRARVQKAKQMRDNFISSNKSGT